MSSESPPPPVNVRKGLTYAEAGVDVSAGEKAVERIRSAVASTKTPGAMGAIGGFAGLFSLNQAGKWRDPVLLSSTDGVGTKMSIAVQAGIYDTIGIDLVAMCVDDLACAGGKPLFLLDYVVMEKLDEEVVTSIVSGVASGCRDVGAALIGGEMAEHPGTMSPGEFDLAGFAVGVAESDRLWGADKVEPADIIIGLPSPGLRSNGYSLARRALFEMGGRTLEQPAWTGAAVTLAEELLRPSVLYSPGLVELGQTAQVHAAAHVTGGGIASNLCRSIPRNCDAVLDVGSWEVPPIFGEVQRCGEISLEEMTKVFNLGLGMMVIVPTESIDAALAALADFDPRVVGRIEAGSGDVKLQGVWNGLIAT